MSEPIKIVRETFLSQKPNPSGFTFSLISLLVVCGVSGIYWEQIEPYHRLVAGARDRIFIHGEYWRVFTAMAVHSNVTHLLSNALPLGVLIWLVHGYFGQAIYPWMSLCLGAAVNLISIYTYPSGSVLVGASGLVYLLAAFWLTMYIFLDRRFSMPKRLLRATGFALIVFFPTTFEEKVSYRTHAIAFGMGIFWALAYFPLQIKRFRTAEVIEVEEVP